MITDINISDFLDNLEAKCIKINKRFYAKGQTVTTYIEKRNQMCILNKGEADLIRYDFNGNKTIIGHFSNHDIFGEVLYPANTNNELFVQAKTDCEVFSFIYDDVLNKCKSNCSFHKELSEKINIMLMNQFVNLNTRIELLTKKNTRDKLLSYFEIQSNQNLSKSFYLPFSLTDLADFLSVDRSAMMREITYLKEEGFIKKNGKRITLLYE